MHLTKVTLKNYGVYRDKTEFDFSTTSDKPVVLVGGTNGAGKTTLFESILVGFYGISFLGKKTTKKEYNKFLANKIHRFLGSTASADSTSIIIDFKYFHNGDVDDYTVDRTWRNEDGRIIEELKIKKDGQRLESVEESQWQSFIEELIPRGVAKLFFFDGEKIVKMAEEENEDIEIKSSFDSLLGLDIVEQLHSDLKVHIMRNMKDDTKTIQIQHDQHLKERDEILDDISRYEAKLGAKNKDADDLGHEINTIEAQVSKIGGGFASKRGELKTKKLSLEMKKTALESEMRVLISGPTPLGLIPQQIKSLKAQIIKDEKILKQDIRQEILHEKESELSKLLKSEKLWNEIDTDSQSKEKLIGNILSVFESEQRSKNSSSMFNLSPLDYANILALFNNLETKYLQNLKKLSAEYRDVNDELQKIDVSLVNAPNDDELGPLISKLNSLHEEQGVLKTETGHLEEQINSKNSYLKMLNFKLRNILADKYKDKNAGVQAELATKVQKVLDEYVEKLKIKKLELLEKYLLEEIQRLMHKENLVTKVSVDKNTFEIKLFDKDGNQSPKDLLSKGEKQMYATAVLLALAKTSGKPLPFMIDTPLARLDVGHRDNLIKKFFPYASHQVVIFSTDSEIDQKYYLQMKPYLSRSYAMEYLPGEGKTHQHSSYFWNDKGEKIVAV
jgi:DNA sulfur modification protein DndD